METLPWRFLQDTIAPSLNKLSIIMSLRRLEYFEGRMHISLTGKGLTIIHEIEPASIFRLYPIRYFMERHRCLGTDAVGRAQCS
jgi:hypothetical protein